MQTPARIMNLSITVFIVREGDGFRLRWFTPRAKGVLLRHKNTRRCPYPREGEDPGKDEQVQLFTKSGILSAVRGEISEIRIFRFCRKNRYLTRPGSAVHGDTNLLVGKNRSENLVETASEREVWTIRPDFSGL